MRLIDYQKIYEGITGLPFYLACTAHPLSIFLTEEEDCIEYLRLLLQAKGKNGRVFWVQSKIVDGKIVGRALKKAPSRRRVSTPALYMKALNDAGFYGLFGGYTKQPITTPPQNVWICPNCGLAVPRHYLRCICSYPEQEE